MNWPSIQSEKIAQISFASFETPNRSTARKSNHIRLSLMPMDTALPVSCCASPKLAKLVITQTLVAVQQRAEAPGRVLLHRRQRVRVDPERHLDPLVASRCWTTCGATPALSSNVADVWRSPCA